MIPQGMVCTSDIVHALMKLRYKYHDLLALEDVAKEPYIPVIEVEGASIERIPQDCARGLEKGGFLELINMPHFGLPTEVNACVKQLSCVSMVGIYG